MRAAGRHLVRLSRGAGGLGCVGEGMLKTLRSVVRFRPLRFRAVDRRLSTAASVADYRRIARRRLPRGVFDYVDGGAEDELTLRRNSEAFGRLEFRPRVLADVGQVDISTSLLGRHLPAPVVLAPTGFTRIVTAGGELDVARAAARAGLPSTLSTMATRSVEEVAAVSDGPRWFQVYVWRDRALVKDLLARAAATGYEAIVITVDTAVLGRRERDVRHGFTLPPKIGPRTLLDGALHPAWTWNFVTAEPITFANAAGTAAGDGSTAVRLADYINAQFDPSLSWRDLDWFRAEWDGPIVLKGIQTAEDARTAAAAGVEAIALSNHGGRQLDGAPVPVEHLAEAAGAVAGQAEIICDGGIRRGSDIVKALALCARACMIGRAYLYGLGAAGERGVEGVLALLADDMRRTMALLGRRSVADLDADVVRWRDHGSFQA
jgi:L-lactate dehydrogenase (cytochrome)